MSDEAIQKKGSRRKRWLIRAGVFLATIFATLGTLFALMMYFTFQGVAELRDGVVIGPATTVVDGYVAAFILDAGDGQVVLIDAGQSADAEPIVEALARMDREPSDVVAILLTHGHEDHRAGVAQFENAEIYAHVDELPLLRGEVAPRGPIAGLSGRSDAIVVEHPLRDAQTVTIGELEIRVFHMPGHTDGSVAYWINGTLFMGDNGHAMESGAADRAPWVFSDSVLGNCASLASLPSRIDAANVDVDGVVFSHSAPLSGMGPLRELADRCRRR